MADIRCPSCGKNNPDFLDVCQFCQTPLTSDSGLQIGQGPTKKNTSELEPILPEWLRDVRKQGRESAEEDASAISATRPQIQKNDAPDLLAGLTSQAHDDEDDEDDIPDWLSSINPVVKPKPSVTSAPEPSIDFFAQFSEKSAPSKASEPPKPEPSTPEPQPPAQKDDLSEWFSGVAAEPEPFSLQPDSKQEISDWASQFNSAQPASQPAPEEKEDLGWLHSLEESSKQSAPSQDASWNFGAPSTPSSSQEDLGWLNQLGGTSTPEPPVSSQPSTQEDLGWLNALGGTPVEPPAAQPAQKEDLSWLNDLGGTPQPSQPAEEDMGWLNALGGTPVETPSAQPSQQGDLSWLNDLGGTAEPIQPAVSKPAEEDLSWLNTLGGTPVEPPVAQPSQQEDLSWLNALSGTPTPVEQPASQPSQQEDLSWLNVLGGTSEPAQPAPTSSASQDDLSWLNSLGGVEPAQPATSTPEPASTPAAPDELDWLKNFAASGDSSQPAASESADLSWLDTLGAAGTSQLTPAEPAEPPEKIDWLSGLGETSAPEDFPSSKPFATTSELHLPKKTDDAPITPFMQGRTAPLGGEPVDNMPDWLKKAMEPTPDLPLGAGAFEQFRETPRKPVDENPLPPTAVPATVKPDSFSTPADSFSNQDVDSLFSMEMPDWLSKQPETGDTSSAQTDAQTSDESLAPVELPSWVQAMRPVESVLETGPSIETQPTEKEGPLAGLRGVIPSAPIGSARRPKAISLKLQATDEQQAGAALFDQILAGEALPRAVRFDTTVSSQRMLRWVIAGITILVLSAILFMRSQFMPVSAQLPTDVVAATGAINSIPNNSSVLVVVDYEPSLAGEMEAVAAPVLNQIILAHQPKLTLLATSPESAGLIERLLTNARITAPDGFAYSAGNQYFNLGYLPGGTAGIIGFISQPSRFTSATAQSFSEYSAVLLLTDHAESGRAWVEQLDIAKRSDPTLANQFLILATSAQAGPLLQPYVSSKQVSGMVNGLADAARFEFANAIPETNRIARNYWDAFGIGILMAIIIIIVGSVWSLITGLRARHLSGEQG